ncbi:MAG: hypothetical protein ACXWCW_31095, partial [Burkholderiales bacterium]
LPQLIDIGLAEICAKGRGFPRAAPILARLVKSDPVDEIDKTGIGADRIKEWKHLQRLQRRALERCSPTWLTYPGTAWPPAS